MAALFGVFLGVCFRSLVESDMYPWPVARLNAETILSFHGKKDEGKGKGTDNNEEDGVEAAVRL